MTLLFASFIIIFLSGLASLILPANRASRASAIGIAVGCLPALGAALRVLATAESQVAQISWNLPFGSLSFELDPLSAFFLIPVLVLSAAAAIYGWGYLHHDEGSLRCRFSWFFFALLTISMAVVTLARNGMLFLIAWEAMSLTSFFLVVYEGDQAGVRRAGWLYLIAAHLGTACLLLFFGLAAHGSSTLDFQSLNLGYGHDRMLLLILALIGFGTKMGLVPLHIWLPEAHPAAPSHVSAVMSGAMIKMGLYGFLRVIYLGHQAVGAGEAAFLALLGLFSAFYGIVCAMGQRDMKRLLAYSSVENMGIIVAGIGLGLWGARYGAPAVTVLAFSGALLHILNHALFKSLLFFSAGAVMHGTGTREMDRLGGLLKTMRWTGRATLVGAAAIAGLPPLNGFVSEFLIYCGAFTGVARLPHLSAILALLILGGLALVGGLAVACFTQMAGVVFLGEPRDQAHQGHEVNWKMRIPMAVLAGLCVAMPILAPWFVAHAFNAIVAPMTDSSTAALHPHFASTAVSLRLIAWYGFGFGLLTLLLWAGRNRLLAKRTVRLEKTWGCGYLQPAPRMQYTATSFTRPILALFRLIAGQRGSLSPATGIFPQPLGLTTIRLDAFSARFFRPAYQAFRQALSRLHWIQHGRLQVYVLYIALTLLALLFWGLR